MVENKLKYEEIYRKAIYVVIWLGREITFRIGETNSEINQILSDLNSESFAFITAHNPFSKQLNESENQIRQKQLIKLLQYERLEYLLGFSTNKEKTWKEESLFIFDIIEEKALEIGKRFEQNAILFGEKNNETKLIWCI